MSLKNATQFIPENESENVACRPFYLGKFYLFSIWCQTYKWKNWASIGLDDYIPQFYMTIPWNNMNLNNAIIIGVKQAPLPTYFAQPSINAWHFH